MSGDHNQYQKPTCKDSLQIEAMKLALDALEELMPTGSATFHLRESAIAELNKTIQQAEKREWVGLTDEDIYAIAKEIGHSYFSLARSIEAKLKEKNAYGWQSVSNPTEYLDDLRGGADLNDND
jgi:hypothetical protein